ncbi:MAG: hypothetical protein FWC15_06145, partial [Fibromonadales bacterium]|nr:hypothetical protein [Fibromonadales bacterium]
CGSGFFNSATQFCLNGNTITELCGGDAYSVYQFCANDKVYDLCVGIGYNPANYICCNNAQYDINTYGCCNNKQYFLATQFCNENSVLNKCGGDTYNPATQFCNENGLLNKCGGDTYNPATQFCNENGVLNKCSGSEYNPSTQYCHSDGKTYSCVNKPFNPSTHYCHTDGKTYSCNNEAFNPTIQFCYNGNFVGEYCGIRTETYDPTLYECRANINPNGIYLKAGLTDVAGNKYNAVLIGEQIWMAENLNYNVSGSVCYSNNSFCATYGRLYNWQTAKTVCPYGWHLSSDAEWQELAVITGGEETAGVKLKATKLWDSFNNISGNGMDNYGFSALPGGFGYGNINNSGYVFDDVGKYGGWWSANEQGGSNAYYWIMWYSNERISRNWNGKADMRSVRCVKDQ